MYVLCTRVPFTNSAPVLLSSDRHITCKRGAVNVADGCKFLIILPV